MIILNTISDVLRVTASAATAVDINVFAVDTTATAAAGLRQLTNLASAVLTNFLNAPAASTERVVKFMSFCCKGGANTLLLQFFNGTNAFQLLGSTAVSLSAGDTLVYTDTEGWMVIDATGAQKTVAGVPGPGTIPLTSLATQAADTVLANATAGVASPTAVAVGTNTVLGRVAADIVAAQLVGAQVAAATLPLTTLATQAADTFVANATAGVASPTAVAISAQSVLGRAAADIVNLAATAGQVLGRTAAGGNLGFISPPGALLRAPQIVTATNAAFAHPTGTNFLVVEGVGGGGAGGGSTATAGGCGSGGNSANYGRKTFTSISGTSNITIGAAGTGVSGAAGNNGGNSSFVHNAVTLTIPGGIGGTTLAGAASLAAAVDNAGNAANTGADLSINGDVGEAGARVGALANNARGGEGGSNPLGSGGLSRAGANVAGRAATGFGAGGGGAANPSGAAALAGGSGTPGAFVIWEFG